MERIRDSTPYPALQILEGASAQSSIYLPPWRVTGWANIRSGKQLACAVQVGRSPPASWYLAGGIRIGVQHSKPCLAAKHGLAERSDPDVATQEN